MPVPTLRVFVSSTWLDLQPERGAVKEAVLRMKELQFSGMEHFGSRDETTEQASLDDVDGSRVYVGIFAARYGSGITEKEYRRARERNLPCFIYFKDDVTVPAHLRETDAAQVAKLGTLKQELRASHIIGPDFVNPHDLAAKVTADLHRWLFDEYLSTRLEQAARGQVSQSEAQTLLDAVKDLSLINEHLLARLKKADDVAVPALRQLPPPPRDFTGRESELDELAAQTVQGGVNICGLHGLGGVGKTALALKLAERLKPSHPDAHFYLELKGVSGNPLSVAEALSHVIRAYHPTASLPESESELRALYLSLLHGQRALLLMDEAAGREQVEPLIPPDGCLLLITSHTHFALPGMYARALDTLSPAEARALLLKVAPRIGDQADAVAELCGRLPLALRLAASTLAERINLSAADYVRRLSSATKRLELVNPSLGLSYNLLQPELRKLWRALAVFPDTFDAAAAAHVWGTEADAAQDALGELGRHSLTQWSEAAGRYSLHDLTRLFADSLLTGEERAAGKTAHAEHYLEVLREADKLYEQGGGGSTRALALFDLEWRNIRAGRSWAAERAGDDEAAAALCSDYLRLGSDLFLLRLDPHEHIAWLDSALEAARRLNNRTAEGKHLANLGTPYAVVGENARAAEIYEQALVILREVGDRRGEGLVLSNLGIVAKNSGDLKRAIELHEQCLAVARELEDHKSVGGALGALGNDYAEAGDPRSAIEFYEQQLRIAREVGDRRGEGMALNNLGNIHADSGDKPQAIKFYEQTLAIDLEIGDRRGEGITLGNLGLAYAALGETPRAVECYEKSLAIARQTRDRRGEGEAHYNTALALDRLDRRAEAIVHAEAALAIFNHLEPSSAEEIRATIDRWRGQE